MYNTAFFFNLEHACRGGLIDLVFIVDSSPSFQSVGSEDWKHSLRFLAAIVDKLDIVSTLRVGMVLYSGFAENRFYLNTYSNKNDIKRAILGSPLMAGGTNTTDGMIKARTQQFLPSHGDRQAAPNVVLILTDGWSNNQSRFVSKIIDFQDNATLRENSVTTGLCGQA